MLRHVALVAALVAMPGVAFARVNARDFGAKGDGKADDTAAVQRALAAAAADRGGVVELPKGMYRIDGSLDVPPGVCLAGEWQAPHHANTEHGTVLLATGNAGKEDGPPLIMLHQSSAVKGITVFYPDQDPTAVKPYPWAIRAEGMHGTVEDVTLVNPYMGIDFGTHKNELHYIRNVFGCPLKLGVYVDGTTDIGRIENVHFNPHSWQRCSLGGKARTEAGWKALWAYLEANLEGFRIGQTDWEYMSGCFVILAKTGLHFVKTDRGTPNVVLTQCGSDIGPIGIRVDASQPHAGLAFTNCQVMATVEVGPENSGPVKFSNCGFWPIPKTGSQAVLEGKGTTIFQACHFAGWAADGSDAPCIDVRGGVALIQACDFFKSDKPQLRVGPRAAGATISGCRLQGGERFLIAEPARGRVQSGLNLTE
ncbi:Pectate lyase superfamily protein [Aquisphaera giovannonii]|uniref:Pectate lyase superfamily protein n=1 Tax=Aquisphaera giovannonii TaxID=406548 RepID=A0A5B9VVT6_9BACT|nr:glycosyl hydrolase family 28-related protein [Aquisphaera giovannonii]QEH31971.1 Pectate lyase superfamily protein [Aquisphaera giovannonii]